MEICGINRYMEYMEQYFGLEITRESTYARHELPHEIGDGHVELFSSYGQFQVWITHAQSNRDIDMSYTQDENTYIGLSYVETEDRRNAPKTKQPVSIQAWRTTRSLPSDGLVQGICKANVPLHAVNLMLFEGFFLSCRKTETSEAYFDMLKTIQTFDEQAFMYELYPVLAKMLHCSYEGTARELFMQSCVFDIAAHLVALCDTEHVQPNVTLGSFDIKQIRMVPRILEERLTDPPSISELSRLVAVNECKLKAGFKKIFNVTIYEYLRQVRTERAIELMKNDSSLEQISEQVGYRSTRGFSQAFSACTGVSPTEWRRRHRATFIVDVKETRRNIVE